MATRSYSSEQKGKLTQLFTESIQVWQEVEDLNAGLNDTIAAIAEELEIKPATLKKAIKIAQKAKWTDTADENETIEDLLTTVGRTL